MALVSTKAFVSVDEVGCEQRLYPAVAVSEIFTGSRTYKFGKQTNKDVPAV